MEKTINEQIKQNKEVRLMVDKIKTLGSVCSGIEAASFVLNPMGVDSLWLSEIADFPSRFLATHYPNIPNLGDMNDIPSKIRDKVIDVPDLLCGGTPCQAFSLAGWKNGLSDERGQLTLKYFDILNAIDGVRLKNGKHRANFFWENVEGVLKDKSNAFGCFLAGLAGLDEPIQVKKWSNAGILYGKERNIAWRVLDAKYFGVPQQRKRIYVIGGGKEFHPEKILFEVGNIIQDPYRNDHKISGQISLFDSDDSSFDDSIKITELTRVVDGHRIDVFRCYSDCLYAAYGTKWNGNAAAFNGSLFFAQDGKLRRLSPLECERLMGFPDNYTLLPDCKPTNRYQATGNSWAVPVIKWIMNRLVCDTDLPVLHMPRLNDFGDYQLLMLEDFTYSGGSYINASTFCYDFKISNMLDIVDVNTELAFYISPKGCDGILRRKYEHNAGMNTKLEIILRQCSSNYNK